MTLRQTLSIGLAGSALVMLSGCASWFHSATRHQPEIRVAGVSDAAEGYAREQIAAGRAALDAGNYGEAIAAFRNAQRFPAETASAHNGLGVAYAMIGRADLAERYFRLAVLAEPTNPAFATNLERFYASPAALAARKLRDEPLQPALPELALAPVPQVIVPRSGGASLRVETAANRLERVSDRVVRLVLPQPQRAVPMMATARATPQSARRRNPDYPLRLPLPAAMAASEAQVRASDAARLTASEGRRRADQPRRPRPDNGG